MESSRYGSYVMYNVFCGEGTDTETAILRNHNYVKGIKNSNSKNLNTTCELFNDVIAKGRGRSNCIGYRKHLENGKYDSKYSWFSYNEFKERCTNFANGLRFYNLCQENENDEYNIKKKILIYANNSVDWLTAFYGSHFDNITVATIFNGLGLSLVEIILNQVSVDTIILDKTSLEIILKLAEDGKNISIKNVILTGNKKNYDPKKINSLESFFKVYSFDVILDAGAKNTNKDLVAPTPESICVICYTSGTVDNPKGAVITHRALVCNAEIATPQGFQLCETDCYYCFLPLAHIMGLFISTALMFFGGCVALFSDRHDKIMEDIHMVNPTILCSVPKIIEHIYNSVQNNIDAQGFLTKKLLQRAINSKINQFERRGYVTYSLWDNIILKKLRTLFGTNLRLLLVGGSNLNADVFNFLKSMIGCCVIHGYGQTETCASSCLTNAADYDFNHIGGVSSISELKIVNVEDLNYYVTDKDPISGAARPSGELLIRGANVFKGYYKNQDETKRTLTEDGWFHSGDIVTVLTDHGNAIRIIDRKKNIFKLSNGEYVSPEKIESLITSKSKYVKQICIVPNVNKTYIGAIVVPNQEFYKTEGYDEKGLNESHVTQPILDEILKIERTEQFASHEIIKKIYLTNDDFSVQNNLLSPTLKMKRNIIEKLYAQQIKNYFN